MSLVRNTMTIGGLTLVSRILGFVRDMLMARFMGAGMAADAFLIAWRLPNLFRALFAEGAFSAAFVPMFNRIIGREEGGLSAGIAFAEKTLSVLFPFLIAFTVVMMALAGQIVWAMTGGFPDGGPDKFAITVEYTRICFPYLALISLVSLLGGILNSVDRFWVNAAAPILLNICLIAGLVFFRGDSNIETGRVQAIAVTISGVMQLLWLIWACRRAGISLRLRPPSLSPEVRRLLKVIGPAALGAGAVQFNLLISTSLAATYLREGAVSYLYYADRLNQLPLGLIGIGVGTAMLPSFSRQIGAGNKQQAVDTQNRAIELVLLLTLPAFAALMVASAPLLRALLQHGEFTAADTNASAAVLSAFSLGLPAYVLVKVLTPGFYARGDTKTPVRIALVAMLVNLIGNLSLIWTLQEIGLALSTALSSWVNVALLYLTLRKRGHFHTDARLRHTALRLLVATVLMAAALIPLDHLVYGWSAGLLTERIVALVILCGAGAVVYFAAAFLLGAVPRAELLAMVRRRRA